MRFLWLTAILFFTGCCPEQNYDGWKRVDNPFYKDSSTDSIWVYVGSGDYWTGIWEGKKFYFHLINDTLIIKKQE